MQNVQESESLPPAFMRTELSLSQGPPAHYAVIFFDLYTFQCLASKLGWHVKREVPKAGHIFQIKPSLMSGKCTGFCCRTYAGHSVKCTRAF